MRKTLLTLIIMFSALVLSAQTWQTDFAEAKTLATQGDKTIVMVFQGSDWCAPCMKLNNEIWSSHEFIGFADDHYVMLKVDFPRKKANALSPEQQKKNADLAERYNKKGFFPLVVVMDKDGRVKGETGYKPISPKEYIAHLESFK